MMEWLSCAVRDIAANRIRYTVLAVSMLIGMLSAAAVAISGSTVVDALIAQEELQNGREGSYALGISETTALVRPTFDGSGTRFAAASESYQALSDGGPLSVGFLLDGKISLDNVSSRPGGAGANVSMRWLDGAFEDFFRFPMLAGSELGAHGTFPPEAIVNERAALEFGLTPTEALVLSPEVQPGGGGTCPATGLEARVAGIVADGKDEPQFYGSLPLLEALCSDSFAGQTLELRWVSTAHIADAEKLLREVLERSAIPHDADVRRADTVAEATDQISLVNVMFAIAGGLMLLVTIVAIANVGVSTVRERSVELSIRQAFGATPKHIVAQVLGGPLLLGLCVAALGVLSTLVGVYILVPQMIPAASAIGTPGFPWAGCLAAMASALGAAIIGGLLPAWIALRLPVAVILRR